MSITRSLFAATGEILGQIVFVTLAFLFLIGIIMVPFALAAWLGAWSALVVVALLIVIETIRVWFTTNLERQRKEYKDREREERREIS